MTTPLNNPPAGTPPPPAEKPPALANPVPKVVTPAPAAPKPAAAPPPAPKPRPPRLLAGTVLSKWEPQGRETVLVCGRQKAGGKTTFALSCTRGDERTIVIACDLGRLSVPPGVNRDNVLVLPYQFLTREFSENSVTGHSAPKKDMYMKLTGDLSDIYRAIRDDKALKLADGTEYPPPQNIVLDGASRLNAMLVDGQCSVSNIDDPSELENKAFKFWGRRMRDTMTIIEQFSCLPVNVIITAWIEEKKDANGNYLGIWEPDIGGKVDLLAAGTVGAAVLAYSDTTGGKQVFKIRVRPDGQYPWIGVRDCYTMPEDGKIDVTVTGKPGEKSAWDRVFTDHRKKVTA